MGVNTIILKNYSDIFENIEGAGAITPGMLLGVNADGKVAVHSVAGGPAEKMFAIEDALQGKGIDDDYADGDFVRCWVAGRGDEVNALLTESQTIGVGDFLESAGNGKLQKYGTAAGSGTPTPGSAVAVALEAVTTAAGETKRIKVRII